MERADNGAWASQYRSELGTYESCASKLEGLIRDLLVKAEIDVVAIESRAKDPDSLERKVGEKREGYETPLLDVTDLVGVRVIAYYVEDVEKIGKIIKHEFLVDEENSSDKLDQLEPDRFGYRSVHFVVSLSNRRSSLAEWSVFDGRQAEIQVRTATQHAWAAVEHKLNYRRTSDAPPNLRRRLMRLSALFELGDEQFSAVKKELEDVEAAYSSNVRGGNLDLPIDTSSLEAFIEANAMVDELILQVAGRGFRMESTIADGYRARYDRDLGDLVKILKAIDMETIADLDVVLQELFEDPATVDTITTPFKGVFESWRSPADLLTFFIGIPTNAPTDIFGKIYRKEIVDPIRNLRGESLED